MLGGEYIKLYSEFSLRLICKWVKMENNSFRMGLRHGMPIAVGYLSVSFAFGIFATGSGLGILEALLISMLNVTSAGQLATVPIIVGGGSYIELILSQCVINSRYSLMSVSLSQKMGESVRLSDRFLVAFVNTDEVFAVASTSCVPVGRKYLFGLILTPYIGWSLGTLLGAIAGNVLPTIVISALGIAIYGMFIAIVIPFTKRSRKGLLCVLLSAILSSVFYYVPALSVIPSGFVIIIVALFVSVIFALLFPINVSEVSENG